MASLFNNVHFSMSDKIEQQHTQLKIDQDLLVNGNISGNTISYHLVKLVLVHRQ